MRALAGLALAFVPLHPAPRVAQSAKVEAKLEYRGLLLDRETLKPIAGARIGIDAASISVTTGADGTYVVPIDPGAFGRCVRLGNTISCSKGDPARTNFFVRADGYASMRVDTEHADAWSRQSPLLAWRSASLSGRWLDADGAPVAQRALRIVGRSPFPYRTAADFVEQRTTTDAGGAFRFDGLAARIAWSIVAEGEDMELVDLRAAPLVLAPGEVRAIDVRSPPIRRVVGEVRDTSGRPRPGAEVWLRAGDASGMAVADKSGRFEFASVGADDYAVRAFWPPTYDEVVEGWSGALAVGRGDGPLEFAVQLAPLRRIEGRVLDAAGEPSAGGEVCFDPETNPYSGSVDVEDDGTFVLPEVLPGACRVLAYDSERQRRSAEFAVPATQDRIDLVLEPGARVEGRIAAWKDAHDAIGSDAAAPRTKVSDTRVTVQLLELDERPMPDELSVGSGPPECEVVAGAAFAIDGVPRGRWLAVASSDDGRISAACALTVGADALVHCDADLVLEPAADLLVLAAPGFGACEVDLLRGTELLASFALRADDVRAVRVPAGSVHAVVRRAGQPERATEPQDMIAGRTHVVGVGW